MTEKLNSAMFDRLASPDANVQEAAEALSQWAQRRMWTLDYIPFKYYLPDHLGRTTPQLDQLYSELATHNQILLDRSGEPCCLSGRQPALLKFYPDLHGPWKEETDGSAQSEVR